MKSIISERACSVFLMCVIVGALSCAKEYTGDALQHDGEDADTSKSSSQNNEAVVNYKKSISEEQAVRSAKDFLREKGWFHPGDRVDVEIHEGGGWVVWFLSSPPVPGGFFVVYVSADGSEVRGSPGE